MAAHFNSSMVKAGLFTDPFVEHFLPSKHLPSHKGPLINRGMTTGHYSFHPSCVLGTYLRTASIDRIISQQLAEGPIQIVSFGAGFDTRFYRFEV
jgi:O-methyltransferase involved in polyketide biosynthesis